jgi:hypothetical protein
MPRNISFVGNEWRLEHEEHRRRRTWTALFPRPSPHSELADGGQALITKVEKLRGEDGSHRDSNAGTHAGH